MKKTKITKLFLLALMLMTAITLLGCSEDDDDDLDGLIYNQTIYRAQVNFIGIKIVDIQPGQMLSDGSLEKDTVYVFQVTIFNSAGNVLEVIDSSLPIDSGFDDRSINGQTCSWFISITGSESSFNVTSAS